MQWWYNLLANAYFYLLILFRNTPLQGPCHECGTHLH